MYYRNPDPKIRGLERAVRQGDPQAQLEWVQWQVRTGEIPVGYVELAAELGHPIAQQLVTSRNVIDWTSGKSKISFFERLMAIDGNTYLTVRIACALAEQVLPIFEQRFPKDSRPRAAIVAARRWTEDPTEENRQVASAAAYAAAYAAEEADDATWAGVAVAVAWSASDAAWAAANAATTANANAWAAANANATADYCAVAAPAAAFGWQTNFIAEVLLSLQQV